MRNATPPRKLLLLVASSLFLTGCGGTDTKKDEPPPQMTSRDVMEMFVSSTKPPIVGKQVDVSGRFFVAMPVKTDNRVYIGLDEAKGELRIIAIFKDGYQGRLMTMKMGSPVRFVGRCEGYHSGGDGKTTFIKFDDCELK